MIAASSSSPLKVPDLLPRRCVCRTSLKRLPAWACGHGKCWKRILADRRLLSVGVDCWRNSTAAFKTVRITPQWRRAGKHKYQYDIDFLGRGGDDSGNFPTTRST